MMIKHILQFLVVCRKLEISKKRKNGCATNCGMNGCPHQKICFRKENSRVFWSETRSLCFSRSPGHAIGGYEHLADRGHRPERVQRAAPSLHRSVPSRAPPLLHEPAPPGVHRDAARGRAARLISARPTPLDARRGRDVGSSC